MARQRYKYLCNLVDNPDGVPVFLIPHAGTTPYSLMQLAKRMVSMASVYSFQHSGIDEGTEPSRTCAEMAAEYIVDMKRVQPKGPFIIGGFCLGGTIAVEMTVQLEQQNEVVAKLLLFDTLAPLMSADETARIGDDGGNSELPDLGTKLLDQGIRQTVHMAVENAIREFEYLPPELAHRMGKLLDAHVTAGLNYQYSSIRADTVLIRTIAHDYIVFFNWWNICSGMFTKIEAPGDSFSILKAPFVEWLGTTVCDLLSGTNAISTVD